jgi:hypothetical protein
MFNTLARYWKAGAAFVGGLVGLYGTVALDEAITFEEVGYVKGTVVALVAAFLTAVSPRNREV